MASDAPPRRRRRILRWTLGVLLALLLIPVALVAIVLIVLNTGFGRAQVEARLPGLTGGLVRIDKLAGRFPDALRIGRVTVSDAQGVYVTIDDLALDWSPLALIGGTASIDRLAAARIAVARLPVAAQPAQPAQPSSGGFTLPVTVDLRKLDLGRVEVAPPVAGVGAVLAATGSAHAVSLDDAKAKLDLRRLDGPGGTYRLDATLDPRAVAATLAVAEPPEGLIGGLAKLEPAGPVAIEADLHGPRTAIAVALKAKLSLLTASADGAVDLTHQAMTNLRVRANAPAMQPVAGIAWQSVAVDVTANGPFATPAANGTVRVDGLSASGAGVQSIAADLAGDTGHATLHAVLTGLRLPGPKPDLFAADPVAIDAAVALKDPARPATLHVAHKLLDLAATARTAGPLSADATLTVPDLAPLAAAGNVDLRGSTKLDLTARQDGDATAVTLAGPLTVTGGADPAPKLIGDGHIDAAASLRGQDVTLDHLTLTGAALGVETKATLVNQVVSADWRVTLPDLRVLAPDAPGRMTVTGHAAGPTNDLTIDTRLDSVVTTAGHEGPLDAEVHLAGMPANPSGHITAHGELERAPLVLDIDATRAANNALHVAIDQLTWKSLRASGILDLAQGATLPTGHVDLRFDRLADAQPLAGVPVQGAIDLTASTDRNSARLTLSARNAGLPGKAAIASARVEARVTNPTTTPAIDATAKLDGIAASGITGNTNLTVRGPESALAVTLYSKLRGVAGADASAEAALTADVPAHRILLSRLQAAWKGETVRLLAPARITYAPTTEVDRLRLGLGAATIDVAGRVAPTLDLTARVANVTSALAAPFAPGLAADGVISADAKLTGTTAKPSGTVRLDATGLHLRQGPAASVPPASVTARADLANGDARLDAAVHAGPRIALALNGTAAVPGPGALDLRATGQLDLKVLDPILTAQGRRMQGQLGFDATVTGTTAEPRIAGTASLDNGEVQDFALGARVEDIRARVSADGTTVRLDSLTAKAGPGTLAAQGTVGVTAPGKPIDLTITARNARPLASDRMTADLDADLAVQGALAGQLRASGKIAILDAELRVPDHLPTSVATIPVRNAGSPPPIPPPPPKGDAGVTLDLGLNARQIFVRGRGLDVELGGEMHLGGTAAAPDPTGGFQMVRGSLSLAGQTLTFTKGEVSFTGGGIADPSIDFIASTTNGTTTANLEVTGTASDPKLVLSSVPELPQDEVLAQILFHRSASDLSPLQLAQAAAAIASFTGVTGGGSDPLDQVRSALGLDELSVEGSSAGSPGVSAGRYVSPGVFVGVTGGASGASQAQVQVDLYRGLKLKATAGSGASTATGSTTSGQTTSTGSGVGLTYQFEY